MRIRSVLSWLGISLVCAGAPRASAAPDTFRLATYNLENYLLSPAGTRPLKTPSGRAKIRESLRVLRADVVALEEVGGTNALLELRRSLRAEGLNYPEWELVTGFDTNIQVGVLSRFPIVARRPHTRNSFLLFGRRFQVSRGFLEVDIAVTPAYHFTLLATHLKSRRAVDYADEAELREQEAALLREIIDARLRADPRANLVVLGDLNDVKGSRPIRNLIGRGRTKLIDTRPAERNGDTPTNPNPRYDPRLVTWTHFYGKEDTYSRIDYILLSPGLAREWIQEETYVLTLPNWGLGSDHRPITAAFHVGDR
jgi:endonuclease/exonuclease/phosphatase family metal-dependent hydrolase